MSQADADDEVASYMTLKSPGLFRGPPSRASRRSVSRQSVRSVPGDPLVDLMRSMVENSQQENLRREQEAREEARRREQEVREDACRREQEAHEEIKRRERAFEQREYDLRHQTQVEIENRFLHEKLVAAEKEKEKELFALCEKQKQEQLVAEKLLELERQEVELEKQKMELEKQKNVQIAGQQDPGNPRAVSETGSSIGSRDQSEEISEKITFSRKNCFRCRYAVSFCK